MQALIIYSLPILGLEDCVCNVLIEMLSHIFKCTMKYYNKKILPSDQYYVLMADSLGLISSVLIIPPLLKTSNLYYNHRVMGLLEKIQLRC